TNNVKARPSTISTGAAEAERGELRRRHARQHWKLACRLSAGCGGALAIDPRSQGTTAFVSGSLIGYNKSVSAITTSSLRRFWARLEDSVHPDDKPIFAEYPQHTFNLKFPPPAFVGDVDAAPIVILMSNGGYKPGITEREFPDEASISEY